MSEQDTPELVERVARAMRKNHPQLAGWADKPLNEVARAAIEAMREPIPVLMDEAPMRADIWGSREEPIGSFTAAEVWRAMIAAALEPRR